MAQGQVALLQSPLSVKTLACLGLVVVGVEFINCLSMRCVEPSAVHASARTRGCAAPPGRQRVCYPTAPVGGSGGVGVVGRPAIRQPCLRRVEGW